MQGVRRQQDKIKVASARHRPTFPRPPNRAPLFCRRLGTRVARKPGAQAISGFSEPGCQQQAAAADEAAQSALVARGQPHACLEYLRGVQPARFGARPTIVDNTGFRGDEGTRSPWTGPEAEVGFLAIHEKGGIEAAQLIPELPLDEQEAAGHDIASPRLTIVKEHALRIQPAIPREQCPEPEGKTDRAPGRDPLPGGGGI